MKKRFNYLFLMSIIIGLLSVSVLPQVENTGPRGFIDADHDGINDWFSDLNGDGINDLDGKPYNHLFEFVDSNRDGVNDLYQDMDGDGVNDLLLKVRASHPEMQGKNVVDVNKDGVNDITGIVYVRGDFQGRRFGKVLEEYGQVVKKFIDEDGDGQFDGKWRMKYCNQGMDCFVDRDGDGMCDGRGFYRHKQGNKRRGLKKSP